MRHIFTVEETLAALKEAVAERGENYTYEADPLSLSEACSYSTIAGESSCIVGNVLKRLTPDIFESIHEYEWYGEEDGRLCLHEQSIHPKMTVLNNRIELPFDFEALELLAFAQNAQDKGLPWGIVLYDRKMALQSKEPTKR